MAASDERASASAAALALATAFPAVAAPLQLVSVTASEMVATCFTNPTAIAAVEDDALRQVGTLGTDGALVPGTALVAGCDGVGPNVNHADVRIPPTLSPIRVHRSPRSLEVYAPSSVAQ